MKRRLAAVGSIEKIARISKDIPITCSGELRGCPSTIVALDRMLPAGQAFRWKRIPGVHDSSFVWRGVIDKFVFDLSQSDDKIQYVARSEPEILERCDPEKMLSDYFNLHVDYSALLAEWVKKDANFTNQSLDTKGARVLAVEPTEALFSYICSSNNNIPRISKMVENLAQFYGQKLGSVEGTDYFAFPKPIDLIGDGVEKKLRAAGFGYRAAFIVKTARQIEERGGESWLVNLKSREVPYSTAAESLLELTGVGRKVADCVCLVGLGKFESVPIDTHVFQVANKLYEIPCLSSLKSKTKTKNGAKAVKTAVTASMYHEIGTFFRDLWGPYAGWAQQILFTQRVLDRHTS